MAKREEKSLVLFGNRTQQHPVTRRLTDAVQMAMTVFDDKNMICNIMPQVDHCMAMIWRNGRVYLYAKPYVEAPPSAFAAVCSLATFQKFVSGDMLEGAVLGDILTDPAPLQLDYTKGVGTSIIEAIRNYESQHPWYYTEQSSTH